MEHGFSKPNNQPRIHCIRSYLHFLATDFRGVGDGLLLVPLGGSPRSSYATLDSSLWLMYDTKTRRSSRFPQLLVFGILQVPSKPDWIRKILLIAGYPRMCVQLLYIP